MPTEHTHAKKQAVYISLNACVKAINCIPNFISVYTYFMSYGIKFNFMLKKKSPPQNPTSIYHHIPPYTTVGI